MNKKNILEGFQLFIINFQKQSYDLLINHLEVNFVWTLLPKGSLMDDFFTLLQK